MTVGGAKDPPPETNIRPDEGALNKFSGPLKRSAVLLMEEVAIVFHELPRFGMLEIWHTLEGSVIYRLEISVSSLWRVMLFNFLVSVASTPLFVCIVIRGRS